MNPVLVKRVVPNLVLLALAGFAWMQTAAIDEAAGGAAVGPGLWPRVICVVLALTSVLGIAGALIGGAEPPAADDDAARDAPLAIPETQPWMVWFAVAATGLFVFALPELGFLCAAVLYAMALLVIGGMRRWVLVLPVAAALSVVFTIIFMKIVYVALPLGEGPFKDVSLFAFRLLGIH